MIDPKVCPYCDAILPAHRLSCATQRRELVNTVAITDTDADTELAQIGSEADPLGKSQHTPGAKLDAGKMRAWLCLAGFSRALEAVAEVTTFGANKYTPNGWTQVPDGEARYMDAYGRHMFKFGQGERVDPDSKCLHKAQMIWNLLASLELELRAENGRPG